MRTSNLRSGKGSRAASACMSLHPAGRFGTRASIFDEMSAPIASRGAVARRANSRSSPPVPQPRSSRRSSGPISARSSAAFSAVRSSHSCQS